MGLGGGYGGAADRDDESERAPLARVRAPVPACPPPSRQALTLEGRAGGPQASSSEEDVHDPLAEDGGLRNGLEAPAGNPTLKTAGRAGSRRYAHFAMPPCEVVAVDWLSSFVVHYTY